MGRVIVGTNGVVLLFVALLSVTDAANGPVADRSEQAAQRFVAELEPRLLADLNEQTMLWWTYITNFTTEGRTQRKHIELKLAKYRKEVADEIRQYGDYNNFSDTDLKRRIHKLNDLGYAALDLDKFGQLLDVKSRMKANYGSAKVCEYRNKANCHALLEQEVLAMVANSRDPDELQHYWVQWHEAASKPVRNDFNEYVALNREAARLNKFTSGAEYLLSAYEDDTFEEQVDAALHQIKPLYDQVHAYVRHKLRMHYGSALVSEKGPIPLHLLGDLSGETWEHIADITEPFPGKQMVNITAEMVRQGYTVKKMFDMGDEFYQSINLTKLPPTFWEKSIFEKPKNDSEFICSTRMWDFYKKDDVRIRKCTAITEKELFLVHHELAFIQYYLQYQHQPSMYREAANPGFLEAFGGTITLSFNSPKHLAKIGLLKDMLQDEETRLNHDFRTVLNKLVMLPFAYSLENYRYEILREAIKPEEYNCKYWQMRSRYSGVEPPVVRSEDDFDAAATYYLPGDFELLHFFVSHVVQFQIHRAACEKAGEYVKGDPEKTLNNCDIYQSTAAGNALKEMLAMGASKPWPEAMEALTGERKINVDAFMEYFQPLHDFLVRENKRLGAHVGWETNLKCKSS